MGKHRIMPGLAELFPQGFGGCYDSDRGLMKNRAALIDEFSQQPLLYIQLPVDLDMLHVSIEYRIGNDDGMPGLFPKQLFRFISRRNETCHMFFTDMILPYTVTECTWWLHDKNVHTQSPFISGFMDWKRTLPRHHKARRKKVKLESRPIFLIDTTISIAVK